MTSSGASHTPGHGAGARPSAGRTAALSLGALGVVYGDIGTSPLYAIRESFEGAGHELHVVEANVLGILSLIFWSLVIVVTIKYLLLVMRADNEGEGGILALTSLITPKRGPSSRSRVTLILVGLFGTALLYGDGMITPAISVVSAVEGTAIATDSLADYVVPISVVILVGVFAFQRKGTGAVGRVFGPVMVLWFGVLAVLGVIQIAEHPDILRALSPTYAVTFFGDNGLKGFLALGSVFLVVTGGEALYADMGHFGRRPIQIGWFGVVLPGLMLHYLGQGALLVSNPEHIDSPLYRMVPESLVVPLVVLATVATVIASQALISGSFSLTMQAVQLGYLPRVLIKHTSVTEQGQVYIPAVNWALMVSCIGLVVGFQSSPGLAAAYGVAVTLTMIITTVLFAVIARERWRWSRATTGLVCGSLLFVDVAFFGANVFKIPHGGWFPLVIGAVVFTLLTTWRSGRRIVADRLRQGQLPIGTFIESLRKNPPVRVPGTAVYLARTPLAAPPAMLANLRANEVLHERVVVVSIVTDDVPRVPQARRDRVENLGSGFFRVELHYGFMEEPDVPQALGAIVRRDLVADPQHTVYFLGKELLLVTDRPGMAQWRERLFVAMSRNSTSAATYFNLPIERTVELAVQVEL